MALAVYEHLPRDPTSKEWLMKVFQAAIKEYREVWMVKDRLTKIGLSRYYGEGIGPPPEVEPGHFDAVYKPYAKNFDMTVAEVDDFWSGLKEIFQEGFSGGSEGSSGGGGFSGGGGGFGGGGASGGW